MLIIFFFKSLKHKKLMDKYTQKLEQLYHDVNVNALERKYGFPKQEILRLKEENRALTNELKVNNDAILGVLNKLKKHKSQSE